MASVRYAVLAACQRAGLRSQAGWESEAAAWIKKQGDIPCAYVGYRRGIGVAGYDDVSVVFGGNDARASLLRVRDELEKSLDFRSESETTIEGNPALVMTARAKNREYFVYGGAIQPAPPTPTVDYMYFEAQEANSTVSMTSSLEAAPNLEYSTDGGQTWQEWQHTTANGVHTFDTLTLTAVGDRVYLRGDNPEGLGVMPEGAEMPLYSHFDMTGKIAAGGNIMSLLDKDAEMTEVPPYGFVFLFGDTTRENPNTSLTSAAAMPAVTTIGDYGCGSMYYGCTSLTSAAAMPAVTTIGAVGCTGMYAGCTALTSAAAMPAVTTIGTNGCGSMYSGCTSMTAAAAMSTVTTIGTRGCAGMYAGCTSLTAAADMPQLTAISNNGCFEMYSGCTSLTTAAAMPAVTNIGDEGCYNMYGSCTSLTAAADMPQLTTIGASGCYFMYNGCTSLATAAAMPAVTTIGNDGCFYMYKGCTSLTAAAAMPAVTTIGARGCRYMYSGCTFNMSNDGTTLNFDFPAPPITAGGTTYSTAYDVAEWMGNTNGFN